MLSAHRSKSILRQCSIPSIRYGLTSREYHGDPGPSTRSNQKNLRSALIAASRLENGSGSGKHLPKTLVNADREVLDNLLNAKPFNVTQRPRTERIASLPLKLPTSDRQRNDNYTQIDEDPFTTSIRLKKLIQKYSKSPNQQITDLQNEEVISVVMNAPRNAINAPVWNILLGFMGRQRKLNWMWSLYNDMKKRGIKPTTRTYSTMINAYSRISHSGDIAFGNDLMVVTELTHSRVTILFEQSQQHIKKSMTASSLLKEDSDLGVTTSTGGRLVDANNTNNSNGEEQNEYEEEVNISPTNAYLKYLGRHGLWEEMYQTFVSMDTTGPLSPDIVTYTTLFSSLHTIHSIRDRMGKLNSNSNTNVEQDRKPINIGPISRGIWDQCIRQFDRTINDKDRKLDNELFNHVLRCLIKGRPEDQRFAISLVNDIWGLPPPGKQSSLASTNSNENLSIVSTNHNNLPKLKPNISSATSLIQGLLISKQNVLSSHYTNLLLSKNEIQSSVDLHFLKTAINALSESGDISSILNILDSYQPPTGKEGWDLSIYKMAIQGSRWAGDFNSALNLFKRATQINDKIEDISPIDKSKQSQEEEYKWISPNGDTKDSRGINWVRSKPIKPDSSILSILLKISIQTTNENIKKILNLINHFGLESLFVIYPGSIRSEKFNKQQKEISLIGNTPETFQLNENKKTRVLGDLIDFSKLIISSIERLNPLQQNEYSEMKGKMESLIGTWKDQVGKSKKNGDFDKPRNTRLRINRRSNDSEEGSRSREDRQEDQWEDEESDNIPNFRNNNERKSFDNRGRGERSFGRSEREGYQTPKIRSNEDRGRRNEAFLRGRSRDNDDTQETDGSRQYEPFERTGRSHEHKPFGRYDNDRPRRGRDFEGIDGPKRTRGGGFEDNDRPRRAGRFGMDDDRPKREERGSFDRGDRPRRERSFDRGDRPKGDGPPKKLSFGLKRD